MGVAAVERLFPILLLAVGCGNVTHVVDATGGAGGKPVAPSGGQAGMPTPPDDAYPQVVWVRGYPGDAKLVDAKVGPGGVVYVTGTHSSPFALGGAGVEAEAGTFLGRLTVDGEGEWLRSYSAIVPRDVEVDGDGNVALCGEAWGSFDLGLGEIALDGIAPFVGELSAEATPLWVDTFEAVDSPSGTGGCAIDSQGSVAFALTGGSPFDVPQRVAIQVSTTGVVEWELEASQAVESYASAAAVGPGDRRFSHWLPGQSIDLGSGAPQAGDPSVLAAFDDEHELLWIVPSRVEIASSMSAEDAGLLVTGLLSGVGEGAHLLSPGGVVEWEWVAPSGVVASAGVLGATGAAWVAGLRDEEPWLGSFVADVSPASDSEPLELGGFVEATVLTRVDAKRLLVGGHYTDDTSIAGEPLVGRGLFLALIETAR